MFPVLICMRRDTMQASRSTELSGSGWVSFRGVEPTVIFILIAGEWAFLPETVHLMGMALLNDT